MKTFHMCVSIGGALRRTDRELLKLFHDPNGVPRSARYIRDWLKLQLALGKRVLPLSKECVGFDYQTGCPGHEETHAGKLMEQSHET